MGRDLLSEYTPQPGSLGFVGGPGNGPIPPQQPTVFSTPEIHPTTAMLLPDAQDLRIRTDIVEIPPPPPPPRLVRFCFLRQLFKFMQ